MISFIEVGISICTECIVNLSRYSSVNFPMPFKISGSIPFLAKTPYGLNFRILNYWLGCFFVIVDRFDWVIVSISLNLLLLISRERLRVIFANLAGPAPMA